MVLDRSQTAYPVSYGARVATALLPLVIVRAVGGWGLWLELRPRAA